MPRPPIPASCAHLELADVERELATRDCNVSATAKALGVPARDLRALTRAHPALVDVAFETIERALDKAQAVVFEGLRSPDLKTRIAAARIVLRLSEATPRRGWGRGRDS